MKTQLNQSIRIVISLAVTLLIWGHIAWDYVHGGIPTHYILHNKDLPGIPNWWGGLVLPLITYFLLFRIQQRIKKPASKETLQKIGLRFLSGLIFAVTISICYMQDIQIVDYIMGLVFLMAFIFPIYKSEYFLGWVLGASFTFGAIIPIGFGSLLCLVFFIIYHLVGFIKSLLKSKGN